MRKCRSRMERPVVLITLGDPAGSGPELAVRAALDSRVVRASRPVLMGSISVVEDAGRRLGAEFRVGEVHDLSNLPAQGPGEKLPELWVVPHGDLSPREYEKGLPSAVGGQHTVEVARAAAELALLGLVDAVCTAPSSKHSFHLAGLPFRGIGEVFQEVTGVGEAPSMLVHERLRVVLATSHVPIRSVSELLDKDRIRGVIAVLHRTLEEIFGLRSPKLGVAGLNPHCGEGGLFGTEEERILSPAIEESRDSGLRVSGPILPDFVFPKMQAGELDGAVMMYHDQAHIPLKALALYRPVTLLLGLPVLRTSVAHGTVWGKAEAGTADPSGMIEACLLAASLARRRKEAR